MNRFRREMKKKKKQIIFMVNDDFNSKNVIWGSSHTDERGEYMLEWSRTNDMNILNDCAYTHKNSNGKTDVLDLMVLDLALVECPFSQIHKNKDG